MVRAALLIILCIAAGPVYGRGFEYSREVEEIFKEYDAEGTFVYYDLQKETTEGWNEERAGKGYRSGSTFNIINVLTGLTTGAVEGVEGEIYIYAGEGEELQISALEQLEVLARLVRRELPLETTLQDEVYDTLKIEIDEGYSLYGKTGWTVSDAGIPVGWFAGWAETGEGIYVFALNMDGGESQKLWKGEEAAVKSLKALNIISK